MYLDEFFYYKNQFMDDIMHTPEIIGLMTDDPIIIADPTLLIYKQIFPFEYIPQTIEHGHTYICCEVDVKRVFNSNKLQGIINIWEFTHKDKLRLPQGGVRTDALAHEIDKKINGSFWYGMGTLELNSVSRFAPINDWQGKMMVYQTKEVNRLNPTDKQRPINRKTGNVTEESTV